MTGPDAPQDATNGAQMDSRTAYRQYVAAADAAYETLQASGGNIEPGSPEGDRLAELFDAADLAWERYDAAYHAENEPEAAS
jgi:hypothetical protein